MKNMTTEHGWAGLRGPHKLPGRFALMAMAMLMGVPVRGAEAPLPDLTKGTSGIDRSLTYNLGPTGMRGWIYTPHHSPNITYLDAMQGRTTASSRQILVTHVGAKSPADGVMMVDDVILGAGGKLFSDDARKSIAWAIQEAEKESNGGVLKLTLWRKGQTEEVQLKLRVMGTYSDTAPYNCPKSKKILEEACAALQKEKGMWPEINGIALLATGDPRFLPQVTKLAREVGPSSLQLPYQEMRWVWDLGYRGIFLSEYYLQTGDKSVEHAINEITILLAKGQSLYGTMGHKMAGLTPEGKFHGSVAPYGPVNMCGLSCNVAIMLGKRCGVKDPEIEPAVARANGFFGYYINKGTIPYGEHDPWVFHENNGKSALCAAMFGLQSDRVKETQYWAKMCVAAHTSTEVGHTGQGFSYLWRMVGANMGGPLASAAFFKEMSWHFDLARRCDGTFTYDGDEQYGPGKTEDNTYYGKSSYNDISPTACHILSYAAPLRKLCITGKDMTPVTVGKESKAPAWLSKQEVEDAIAAGRFDLDRKKMSVRELAKALGSWSPVVRLWAAEELAGRPEAKGLVPQLIGLVDGSNAQLRLGACQTLRHIKSQQALPVFVRLLRHDDRGLRYLAACGILDLGGAAKPALNDILKAFVETAEPLQPVNWADPVQFSNGRLIHALFEGGLTDALKQADPQLLLNSIRVASTHPDGAARSKMMPFIRKLTEDEAKALLPTLVELATTHSPADTMFSREPRLEAFRILVKYRFPEAIKAAPLVAGGKYGSHYTAEVMKLLETYGAAAKGIIADLKVLLAKHQELRKEWAFPEESTTSIEHAIKVIEESKR